VKKYYKKKKIVIFAYSQIGYESIKILNNLNLEIIYVITHVNNPKERIWFNSIESICKKLKIKFLYFEKVGFNKIYNKLRRHNIDCIFSFYFRRIIPDNILNCAKIGGVNVHGSYLPSYRGRSPVNWQIINGEKNGGVSFHFMKKKADSGDIICQKKLKILNSDNAISLQKKINKASRKLLLQNSQKILNNEIKSFKQNKQKSSYFGARKPEDGLLSLKMNSIKIYNMVRALSFPYPGAFLYYKKKKIIINKCKIMNKKISQKKKLFIHNNNLLIKTIDSKYINIQEIILDSAKIKGSRLISYFKNL
jgi:methionyl-tRNA formyltransferase